MPSCPRPAWAFFVIFLLLHRFASPLSNPPSVCLWQMGCFDVHPVKTRFSACSAPLREKIFARMRDSGGLQRKMGRQNAKINNIYRMKNHPQSPRLCRTGNPLCIHSPPAGHSLLSSIAPAAENGDGWSVQNFCAFCAFSRLLFRIPSCGLLRMMRGSA